MVPLGHLTQAALGSEMFTGAALDGVPQDVNDDEVAPHPDLEHPIIMPFNRESPGSQAICGSVTPRSRHAAGRSSSA